MTDFDDHMTALKHGASMVATHFEKPDDDWAPTGFFDGPDDFVLMPLRGIPKEDWRPLFRTVRRKTQATFVGFVVSTWYAKVEPGDVDTIRSVTENGVSSLPSRQERLMLEGSDGRTQELWFAEIQRFEDQPAKLGEWHKDEAVETAGRMADLVLQAFQAEDRGPVS